MTDRDPLLKLLQRVRVKANEYGHDALSECERVVYDVNQFDTATDQGGLVQYFESASGVRAWEAIRALDAIGASQAARILEAACMVFPGGASRHHEELAAQLRELDESYAYRARMEDLDSELESAPVYPLLIKYCERNMTQKE